MIYGGMIWYVFPKVDDTISWEGHLAGFVSGFLLSVLYKTEEYKRIVKYDWEKPDYNPSADPFMQRFDENGNFVNLPVQEEVVVSYFSSDHVVVYEYIENKKNELEQEL